MTVVYDLQTILLGHPLGGESLTREYKEFYIRSFYRFFEQNELEKLVDDPNYKLNTNAFNNLVKYELKFYFTNYFSKYCASFIASRVSGNLHFGITDDGIVEGFPFYGEHEKELNGYTSRIYKDAIKTMRIKCKNEKMKSKIYNWYVDNTVIKITKLEICDDLIDNSYKERLDKLKERTQKIKELWAKYKSEYSEWYNTLMYYSQKLRILMNDPKIRNGVIAYIIEKTKENNIEESEYCSVLEYYRSDEMQLEDITLGDILEIKDNNSSPIKWLIEYKDDVVDKWRKKKPRAPIYMERDVDYYMYLSRMCNLVPYLKNRGCNFYNIEIQVPYNPEFEKIEYSIEYQDNNGQWNCKKRVVVNGYPITVDIYDMSYWYK